MNITVSNQDAKIVDGLFSIVANQIESSMAIPYLLTSILKKKNLTKGGRTFPSENISCPYVTAIMPAHCSVKAGTEPSQFTPEIAMV